MGMNATAALVKALPASWLPKLKAIVAGLGSLATVVLAVYPGVNDLRWYTIASAVITIASVYLVPNIKTGTILLRPHPAPAAGDSFTEKHVDPGLIGGGSGGTAYVPWTEPAVRVNVGGPGSGEAPVLPSEAPTPPQPVKPRPPHRLRPLSWLLTLFLRLLRTTTRRPL